MMRRFRFLPVVAACLITAGAAFAGVPQGKTAAFNDAQKKEIETIVRDYLIRHPEVMIDVMQALDAKQTQAKEEQRSDVLSSRRGDIYNSPDDFVAGNPDGDVTIVEFFDYQCGYCKRAFGPLMETLEKDGNVRLVLKEFPILGPASVTASHAAIASMRQGRYFEFHKALFRNRGELSDEKIMKIAADAGLDTAQLKRDMADPKVAAIIERNSELAYALNIGGTPGFIAGGRVLPGALSAEELAALVKEVRATCGANC